MENISIKGHVQIFDENNNLVTEADNMVVASGRLAVRKAFLSNNIFTFKRIILGTNGNITTPDMLLEDTLKTKKSEDIISEQPTIPETINEPLLLELTFSVASYDEYANIKELSLTITDGTTESLFSRVVFSGYPFTKDHTYTMKYSVYF